MGSECLRRKPRSGATANDVSVVVLREINARPHRAGCGHGFQKSHRDESANDVRARTNAAERGEPAPFNFGFDPSLKEAAE